MITHEKDALRLLVLLLLLGSRPRLADAEITLKDPVTSPRRVKCSEHEQTCLSQGKLPSSDGPCFYPLMRGPCPHEWWFVLSASKRPLGKCAPQPRLCGRPSAGRCLSAADALAGLRGCRAFHMNSVGLPLCGPFAGWARELAAVLNCVDDATPSPRVDAGETMKSLSAIASSRVLCSCDDDVNCANQVISAPAEPALEPEY